MKKTIPIVLSLIVVVTTATGFFFSKITENMQIRINAKDLPEHGLVIIKPSDPDFDSLTADYLRGMPSDEIESIRPLSVFIKNSGDKTVVAYAVVWEGIEANGKKDSYKKFVANAEALTDREEYFAALARTTNLDDTISPSTARLISLLSVPSNNSIGGSGSSLQHSQNQSGQNPKNLASQLLTKYTDVTVSIDGVVFEDGSFAGPDTTGFFEKINAQVEAKNELIADITENLRLGKTRDDVFKDIEAKAAGENIKLDDKTPPAEYHKFFTKLYAGRFNQMRKAFGEDETLAIVRRSNEKPKIKLKKK